MAVRLENVVVRYKNGMTVNIGNFQNLQPEYEMSAVVVEGNPDEAFAKIKKKVDALLEADVEDILKEKQSG